MLLLQWLVHQRPEKCSFCTISQVFPDFDIRFLEKFSRFPTLEIRIPDAVSKNSCIWYIGRYICFYFYMNTIHTKGMQSRSWNSFKKTGVICSELLCTKCTSRYSSSQLISARLSIWVHRSLFCSFYHCNDFSSCSPFFAVHCSPFFAAHRFIFFVARFLSFFETGRSLFFAACCSLFFAARCFPFFVACCSLFFAVRLFFCSMSPSLFFCMPLSLLCGQAGTVGLCRWYWGDVGLIVDCVGETVVL